MQTELVLSDKQLPSEVIRLIADGRKIEAIKILREVTGLGLANAKVLVDRAARIHGPKKPMPSAMSEHSGAGRLLAPLVAVMVLATAYFFYLGI
jgi:hypothetical protein